MTHVATKPSRPTILLEAHNLTIASGTGIATYARELASSITNLGFSAEALFGTTRRIADKDPILAQVLLHDATLDKKFHEIIAKEWRSLGLNPFPAMASRVPKSDAVVESGGGKFACFSEVYAVPHLEEREFAHFRRYGRRLTIRGAGAPDVFHATRPAPVRVLGCPNVYTIHDIVPIRLPYTTKDDKKLHLNIVRELCRAADHIVTVSEFSRQDIIKLTGISEDRITNTYQAVSLPDRLLTREEDTVARETKALFGLEFGEYFLFVGALEPKKNVSRLIDAYGASGVKRPLVIAGSDGWLNKGEVDKIKSEQFLYYEISGRRMRPERRVRRLSYLPLDHLVSLIRGARALLFPSLYEGFGLPVLEAMMLGTPVMTSNVSSLPEIAGEAALLVDPYDVESMSRAIVALDADRDLCSELGARGRERAKFFTAEAYEERIKRVYGNLL